jgi:hypothetical protein
MIAHSVKWFTRRAILSEYCSWHCSISSNMERRAAYAQTTKPAREEMAKGDDFETFIGQWAKEHIKPIDAHVDPDDLLYAATLRSDHLTLLAAQNGFYQPLKEKGHAIWRRRSIHRVALRCEAGDSIK